MRIRHAGRAVAMATLLALLMVAAWLEGLSAFRQGADAPTWTGADVALLQSLAIDALPVRAEDASNAYLDDPAAVDLGRRLFSDTRLSADGSMACASCHRPDRAYADGRRLSQGLKTGRRNTPSLVGAAHGRWFNWDGRSDSLWAQALGPLEADAEMAFSRGQLAHLVVNDAELKAGFERVFGAADGPGLAELTPGPCGPSARPGAPACWAALSAATRDHATRLFVNTGKALAAYQATLRPGVTRFDGFVRALAAGDAAAARAALSAAEQRGLRLFIDPARTACLDCHNGPLLSDGGFHDIGTNLGSDASVELGRMLGFRLLEQSEFSCTGRYSDALPEQCTTLRFAKPGHGDDGRGAFKVPTLRNVGRTAPYLHDGRFATLPALLQHYRSPPLAHVPGAHELKPLRLSDAEMDDLASFLDALNELPAAASSAPGA